MHEAVKIRSYGSHSISSMSNIPPDIIELIFDLIQDSNSILESGDTSPHPLKPCALVCRAWIGPARQRLFRCKRFVKLKDPETEDNFAEFLTILQSSPGIAECVREVCFWNNFWCPRWILDLAEICTKFRNVQSVDIFSSRLFTTLDELTIRSFPACFQLIGETATKLMLRNLKIQGKAELHQVLVMLPNLAKTSSSFVTLDNESDEIGNPPRAYPNLHDLQFTDCDPIYCGVFLQPTIVPRLRQLTLSYKWEGPQYAFDSSGTLPSLESLYLHGSHDESPIETSTLCCHLWLIHGFWSGKFATVLACLPDKFPNLKYFTLEDPPGVTHFRNAALKVSHLPPTILIITIIAPWTSHDNLRECRYEEIDSAIINGNFPNLETVEFVFVKHLGYGPNRYSMEEGMGIVEEKFESLDCFKKKIVRLAFR